MDDFEAALAAKVAAQPLDDEAGATTTEETPAEPVENVAEVEAPEPEETPAEDQPRDEKGRFTPKFKSHEEAEKAYENIQSLVGRQGQELGELRAAVERMQEQPSAPPASHGELEAALEENPKGVAMWALQNGNQEVLDEAITAWYDKGVLEGDSKALREVGQFERALEMAQFQSQLSEQISPTLEDVQGQAQKRAIALARRSMAEKHPDLDEVLESATQEELNGLDLELVEQLKERDPAKALETIYRWVKVSRFDAEVAAKNQKAAETVEEKKQAVVAASSSPPGGKVASGKEALKEFILAPEAHSVRDGLVRE